jgi:hypothetical protein
MMAKVAAAEGRLLQVVRGFGWALGIAFVLILIGFAYSNDPNVGYTLVFVALLALIPAGIARNKGASFGTWWFFGFFLFIIALPCVLLMKPDRAAIEAAQIQSGEAKRCPWCAEIIRYEARVCRYCQREQPR